MPGFNLANFANAYIGGQEINLDLQNKQQDLDNRRQEFQFNKFKLQQVQQQQAQQAAYQQDMKKLLAGSEIERQTAKDAADPANSDPALRAASEAKQRYTKLSQLAFQYGDIDNGLKFQKEAESEETRAVSITKNKIEQEQASRGEVGSAAGAALANPDLMATQGDMFKTVMKNQGVEAAMKIPTNPAQYKTWLQQQQLGSLTAKQQLDFQREMSDSAETRREHQEQDKSRQQERQIELTRLAMERANQSEKPPTTKDIDGFVYQFDPSGKTKGDRLSTDDRWVKMGVTQGALSHRDKEKLFVTNVSEMQNSIGRIADLNANLTEGTFSKMGDKHTYLGSLIAVGGNKATPAQSQALSVSLAGLGQEAAVVATVGTGRGPNQKLTEEFQRMIAPQAGDTNFTVAYRWANLRDWTLVRIKTADTSFLSSAEKEQMKSVEQQFEKMPSTADIIAAARQKGSPISTESMQKSAMSQKQLWKLIGEHEAAASSDPSGASAGTGNTEIDSLLSNLKGK